MNSDHDPSASRERFVLRISPSRTPVEDRVQLGRSADYLVDTRDFTVESILKPFIAYQREVRPEVLGDGQTPTVPPDSEAELSTSILDDHEFWPKVAALAKLDWARAQSELSSDATLRAFASRFEAEVAALASTALENSPQLDDVYPGSDALHFWCAPVVFSGRDTHERALRGEPITLEEQTWADGELCLAIVEGALEDRFGAPNPSYEGKSGTASSKEVHSSSKYDEVPIARRMVGIWFVVRLPSGALAECVGVFAREVFEELAGQALAAATWLANEQQVQLVSSVEAYDTRGSEPYDGLEVFTIRRKWKGSLDDYLLERGVIRA